MSFWRFKDHHEESGEDGHFWIIVLQCAYNKPANEKCTDFFFFSGFSSHC
jgi:hypothetical protein